MQKPIYLLLNDSQYIYCFQEEYAVVAIPIKRMQQTIDDLAGRGWLSLISTDRKEYANRIIKSNKRNISIFDNLNNPKSFALGYCYNNLLYAYL